VCHFGTQHKPEKMATLNLRHMRQHQWMGGSSLPASNNLFVQWSDAVVVWGVWAGHLHHLFEVMQTK
jgi:hypothetical protein